ncbi:flagellar brake protein [Bacillus xiapuensis]|uniref:flagellar brake protein n=1 Tax=Bacillus xiapuensis TaxID=2014075 RepID=UPI000C234566|nr:flagellar brake domain-containing protein [Bacillus xiapuensis]
MLKVGLDLMLEPMEDTDEMNEKETLRCKIADISDGKIYIDYPVNLKTNRTAFLMDDTKLKVEFIDPQAASAVYMFSTEVIGRTKKNIQLLILKDPGIKEYKRIQRRRFVRVATAVDVALHFEGRPAFTSATLDISAGGFAIPLPAGQELEAGEEGAIYLSIPMQSGQHYYFKTVGKVVRLHTEEKTNRAIASIQFTEISGKDQQLIMRFCFERQIILKRKGLA